MVGEPHVPSHSKWPYWGHEELEESESDVRCVNRALLLTNPNGLQNKRVLSNDRAKRSLVDSTPVNDLDKAGEVTDEFANHYRYNFKVIH